jgi:mannose-6-phosphate isomerase-like protein (cupin superfamily)
LADYTVKRLEDFEAVFGGGFRRVRAGLGVTSFGLAVMEFPRHFEHYPMHTQEHDSQEEVYTLLSGRAKLEVGDETIDLEPGVWVRVGPAEKRRLLTTDEPARVIAIGGVPGAPYEAPDFTEEGAPDPIGKKYDEMGEQEFTHSPPS